MYNTRIPAAASPVVPRAAVRSSPASRRPSPRGGWAPGAARTSQAPHLRSPPRGPGTRLREASAWSLCARLRRPRRPRRFPCRRRAPRIRSLHGDFDLLEEFREIDLEGRALARLAVHLDVAAALSDDSVRRGKPKAGTLPPLLCRKKGSKTLSRTWAVIPHPLSVTASITWGPAVTPTWIAAYSSSSSTLAVSMVSLPPATSRRGR